MGQWGHRACVRGSQRRGFCGLGRGVLIGLVQWSSNSLRSACVSNPDTCPNVTRGGVTPPPRTLNLISSATSRQPRTTLTQPISPLSNSSEIPGLSHILAIHISNVGGVESGDKTNPGTRPHVTRPHSGRVIQSQGETSLNPQRLMGSQTHPLRLFIPKPPLL